RTVVDAEARRNGWRRVKEAGFLGVFQRTEGTPSLISSTSNPLTSTCQPGGNPTSEWNCRNIEWSYLICANRRSGSTLLADRLQGILHTVFPKLEFRLQYAGLQASTGCVPVWRADGGGVVVYS